MKTLVVNAAKIRENANDEWSSIAAMKGESAYEIAVRRGYTGTEQEWTNALETERAAAVSDIQAAKTNALKDIPSSYQELTDSVDDFKNDLVLVQSAQPNSEDNKIWITEATQEVTVPTYEEFGDLKDEVESNLEILFYGKRASSNGRFDRIPFTFENGKTYYITIKNATETLQEVRINRDLALTTQNMITNFITPDTNVYREYACKADDARYLLVVCPSTITSFEYELTIASISNVGVELPRLFPVKRKVDVLTELNFQNGRPVIEETSESYDITFKVNSNGATMFTRGLTNDGIMHNIFIRANNGAEVETGSRKFSMAKNNGFLCFSAEDISLLNVEMYIKTFDTLTNDDVVLLYSYSNDKVSKLGGRLNEVLTLYPEAETTSESDNDLPSYAVSYMDERVEKVFDTIIDNGANSDTFIFYTDTHFPSNNGMTGRYIANLLQRTPINNVVFGGDVCPAYSNAYSDSTSEQTCKRSIREQFNAINKYAATNGHLFQMKGNHDFHVSENGGTEKYMLNPQQTRNVTMGGSDEFNIVTNDDNPEACYYYIDHPAKNIRYIIVDLCEEFGRNNEWVQTYGVNKSQLLWIAEQAVKTAGDRNFVFLSHVPITDQNTREDLTTRLGVKSLVDAVQSHSSVTIDGEVYDFTSVTGRVLMFLSGHTHRDYMTYSNGILHASIACDARYDDYKYSYLYLHFNDLPPTKTKGTIYESTFDVVNVDAEKNIVKFIRIGGGGDRFFHLGSTAVNAGSNVSLTATLTGTLNWWCYDTDGNTSETDGTISKLVPNETRATVSNGVVTGVASGGVVVVATNGNGEYEFFNVTVN